jgi:UTP:GlnB (protein PII) uridylyltransferase
VEASLQIAGRCLDRLDVDPGERATVLFLIGNHLEIPATLRRDIFNPETVAAFADKVGTRAAQNALPFNLCGHQSREPRGFNAVGR